MPKMDWINVTLLLLSLITVVASGGGNNHFVHRIHVPQKIKTIFHTKIIKVPEHHHYFHEKEKIVPEHHHYIHEKEKLVKVEDHKHDSYSPIDGFDYYRSDDGLEKEEQDDFPPYPPHKDTGFASASEPKRVVHRKRPPQRTVKHHKRKQYYH